MELNISKMSDDELYNRRALIQSRMNWAMNSSYGSSALQQMIYLLEEVNQVITDRIEKTLFEERILSKPAVINLDEPKDIKSAGKTDLRKSRSELITRLRRTSTPQD